MKDRRPADTPLSHVIRTAAFVIAIVWGASVTAPVPSSAQGSDTTRTAPPVTEPATAPVTPPAGAAQPAHDTAAVMTLADSAIQRAQALVAQGHTDQGRTLVDSILGVTPPASPAYASALYAPGHRWRPTPTVPKKTTGGSVSSTRHRRGRPMPCSGWRSSNWRVATGRRRRTIWHGSRRNNCPGNPASLTRALNCRSGSRISTSRICHTRVGRWPAREMRRPRRTSNCGTGSTTTSSGALASPRPPRPR